MVDNLPCVLPPRAQAISDKGRRWCRTWVSVREREKLGMLLCSFCCWAFMVSVGTLGPWCKCCGSTYTLEGAKILVISRYFRVGCPSNWVLQFMDHRLEVSGVDKFWLSMAVWPIIGQLSSKLCLTLVKASQGCDSGQMVKKHGTLFQCLGQQGPVADITTSAPSILIDHKLYLRTQAY